MKCGLSFALMLAMVGGNSIAQAQENNQQSTPPMVRVQKNASVETIKGPETYFTGTAWIDNLFTTEAPSHLSGALVTFEPGARSAWHTHPLGQTLIVESGKGWVQMEGQSAQEILPGDIVTIPANVRHWHGATATTSMSHYALLETKDGQGVVWMEKVSDEQYPQ